MKKISLAIGLVAAFAAVQGVAAAAETNATDEAMVGPKAATCLKALQEGKVVLLCVQNSGSKNAEATLKTVAAFKDDQRISGFAESVVIDPADQAESGFLGKLREEMTDGGAGS